MVTSYLAQVVIYGDMPTVTGSRVPLADRLREERERVPRNSRDLTETKDSLDREFAESDADGVAVNEGLSNVTVNKGSADGQP